jgi:hypothetical protein
LHDLDKNRIIEKKIIRKFDCIVCLVLQRDTDYFLGQHGAGVNENKWGFPSVRMSDKDERPQDTASKLLEVSTLGMYGPITSTKKLCVFQGKTINGILVYKINIEPNLEFKIKHISKYLFKCFPIGGIPAGILAWKQCKMVSMQDALHQSNKDSITKEILEFLKCQNSSLFASSPSGL